MNRLAINILAGFGAVFVVALSYLGVQLFLAVSVSGYPRDLGREDVLHALNWAGLDSSQNFEIVWATRNEYPFMDDYESSYCLVIKTFTESPNHRWTEPSQEDATFSMVRYRASVANHHNERGRCIADTRHSKMHISDARVSSDGLSGWEVLFFDRASGRLLFSGYQL
jgi:hypothetical protein